MGFIHILHSVKLLRIMLLIDVEAQKDFYSGYDLVVRGIYYAARQLSSHKGVEFEKTDYNNIKKE